MSTKPKAKSQATRGRGRPPKVTLAVVQEIGELMALGVPEEYACSLHGINPETFGPAVSRNARYKAAMRVHHARFMAESLRIIKDGGERITVETADGPSEKILPWTGRAWILERRYKPHFNKTEVHKPGEGKGEAGGLMNQDEMLELERITKSLVLGGATAGQGKATTERHG